MQSNQAPPERKHNPYVAGTSVGGSEAFVGRTDILGSVKQVLAHPQQNAIVLFGQRRIGKTSILQELKKRLGSEQSVVYKPVFFDLLGKTYQPLKETLQELAYNICDVLEIDKIRLENIDDFHQQWLPSILKQYPTISLVLLLDEFDALEDDAKFRNTQESFFYYLRDHLLGVSPRINFVFALGRNVGDLSNVAMSVFKNILSVRVSLLAHADTVQLIKFSEINASLNWSDESISKVWQLTSGHPFLTQVLCSRVWEDIASHEPIAKVNHVERNIAAALESGDIALEWLWRGLPPAEKVVSSIIASQNTILISELATQLKSSNAGIVNEKEAIRSLVRWDLIYFNEKTKVLGFRVELIRQWVAENKPMDQVLAEIDRVDTRADNFYQAAQALANTKEYEQAKRQLKQSLNLNPGHIGATQLLINILITQNLFTEAREKSESFYKYNPNLARNPLIYVLKETAKQTADKVDESTACYQRILELDPEQEEIRRKLLDVLYRQTENACQTENYQQANHWLKQIFAIDKNSKDALKLLAKVYAGNNQIDISEYSPEKVADLLFEKQEFEPAIELYMKADKMDKATEAMGHLCCQKLKTQLFKELYLEN